MEREKALIQELRQTLGRLESALSAIHDSLAVTSAEGLLIWCNQPFLDLVGRSKLQVLGQPIQTLLPCDHQGCAILNDQDVVQRRRRDESSAIAILKQDPLHAIEISIETVKSESPHAKIYCFRDISSLLTYQELLIKNAEIQQRASEIEMLNTSLRRSETDLAKKIRECPVTGLPNRRGLLEYLRQAIQSLNGSEDILAAFFCDLDRFKEVNDTHGHQAGDELLLEISRRLRTATRPSDMISRLGGDEFVVVSTGLTSETEACEIAARLQSAIGRPWQIGTELLHPHMSIGIAITRDQGIDEHELLRRADLAMYSAKRAAPGRAEFYAPQTDEEQRLGLENLAQLRECLTRQGLEIHLQPIFELASGRLHGHEVLARLRGRDGRWIAPSSFIPMAEKSRLIGRLGELVLARTLQSLAAQQTQLTFVNVSPLEIANEGYAERLLDQLSLHQVDPCRLHLEITESVLIANVKSTARCLQQLRDAGIKIHLDDFGTGYSSLALLTELPTDGIKIDSSFIQQLNRDRVKTAVIQSIIQLCRELDISVIAEGIETHEQHETLLQLGCDYGQGFLLGRPQPPDTLA